MSTMAERWAYHEVDEPEGSDRTYWSQEKKDSFYTEVGRATAMLSFMEGAPRLSEDHEALLTHISTGSMALGVVYVDGPHPHPVVAYRDERGWLFICSGQHNYLFPLTKERDIFLDACKKLRLQWTPQ